MRSNRVRTVVSALLAAAALSGVAACGSDDEAADTTTTQAAAATSAAPSTAAPTSAAATTPATDAPATSAAAATTAAPTTDAPPTSNVQDEVDALYEAAKEEGEVTLYTTANEVQVQPAVDGFMSRYPGIKVNWFRTSTPEMVQRFSAEFDSGANTTDVIHAPDTTFLRAAIADERLIPLNDAELPGGFPGEFPEEWVIDDGQLAVQTVTLSGLAFNSGLIDESEAPKTWEDLLDPKWKGQIIALDPTTAGGAIFEFWDFIERALGPEYLTAFAAQEPIWYDTAVPGAQAHAAGEAPLFIPAFPSLTEQMKANGAPVVQVEQKVATGVIFAALPVVDSPHPNAARLLVYDMYGKTSTDEFANASGQVSPWGGGNSSTPDDFFFPDSANANSDARKAEIVELLGLG